MQLDLRKIGEAIDKYLRFKWTYSRNSEYVNTYAHQFPDGGRIELLEMPERAGGGIKVLLYSPRVELIDYPRIIEDLKLKTSLPVDAENQYVDVEKVNGRLTGCIVTVALAEPRTVTHAYFDSAIHGYDRFAQEKNSERLKEMSEKSVSDLERWIEDQAR